MTNSDDDSRSIATLRILDAAINRAGEGLRVVEDFARLSLNDSHLSQLSKQLRHGLTQACSLLDKEQLLAARDTLADVGTTVGLASEYARTATSQVLLANFARVQQSLRTIEEYGKTLSEDLARQIEQLRYQSYTLEKALLATWSNSLNLQDVQIYVLLDGKGSPEEFRSLVRQLRDGGANLFQLRDKQLEPRELLGRATILREELQPHGIRWLLNDRADLALAAAADGVHLGQEDLDLATARRILGPRKLIGLSTHSIEQARAAVLAGADYIGVGPVFPSQTKSFTQFAGLELVREVAAEISLPAFAIGGIDETNVALVRKAGLQRAALSGAVCRSVDPAQSLRAIRAALLD
jgi:thiamine-phosphate pyrophosphorylase